MFQTRFNRKALPGLAFNAPSLVQPQFQRQQDINFMIQRALGGDMSVFRKPGNLVDASDCPDSYHECLNVVTRAQQAWDSLPDAVKRAYGNAAKFIEEYDKQVMKASKPVVDDSAVVADIKDCHPEGAEASTPKSAPNT